MPRPPREPEHAADLTWLFFGAATLLLASGLRELWAEDGAAWWTPFAVWLAVLALAGVVTRTWIRNGD